ncbi:hypothetical protein ASG11_11335 [Sphingomonas sp. Leaf357]|uniref:hypothetical protein n=1 Tax=Sphingomonas sp. Leaf357 TaxID=1736350 RepID=UPI0006F943E9|nr:hypothetical protein [Sphingomonas sp. Leaf357]KQS04769.1 hypothetical protein ASG11_11335 [Sphingomonas sp. Leaf357]
MNRALPALLLLAACSREGTTPAPNATPATGLEAAAIAAGVIPDPASADITGLYARETDRVCIVPAAKNYRIGVFVDYGDNLNCAGSGTVTRDGETLSIDIPAAPGCSFRARFEGDRIVFPAQVPEACAGVCQRRASIAALDVERLSESASEASTLRDTKGRLLCGGD